MALRSLPAGEYWDAKLPSFGVRIGARTSTFLLKKGNRRVKLGTYPALSLADARRKAHTLKADPETQAADITFREAVDLFLATHCKGYRARVLAETERMLKKLAPLDKRKLAKVTTHDLNAIIDAQAPSEANHLFKTARTFFRFCIRRRLLMYSPLQGLAIPNREQARARVLTDAELKSIWEACESCGAFGIIVRLLILTGQRRGEIAALHTSWLNLDSKAVTIPATITKNGREHTFPIGSVCQSILSTHQPKAANSLFFPATTSNSSQTTFSAWSKSKANLDKLSGVSDWTLHDLRRTFATTLARLGTPIHVVEKLLNHVSGTTGGLVAVYQKHQWWDEQVVAINAYESHLQRILKVP